MNIYFVNTDNDISDIVYAENPNEAIEITRERCLEEQILSEKAAEDAVFTTKAIEPAKVGDSSFITWIMKADRENYLSGSALPKVDKNINHIDASKDSKDLYFVVSDNYLAAMVYTENKNEAIELVKDKALENTLFDKDVIDSMTYSALKLDKFIVPILGSYHLGWAYKNGCNDYLKPAREHYQQSLSEQELLDEVVWN